MEWENTPIMGQIQIIKKSADDNPINALPAGTLLEGAVFEIYDKAGNVVDTIVSDYNGRAVSKLLPLGRYTIREVQAPDYYAINPTVLTAYLDYEGQIVTFEVEDNSVSTGVAIKKTGYAEVMPNQPIQYTITGIGNTSTVPLSSFYWRDTLPGQVSLSKVVTGTYNQQLSYKIVYKTNLKDSYQTLADSLSTDVYKRQTMDLSAYSNYTDDPNDDPEGTGLRILKYETGTELPLAGALFEVIGPEGDSIGTFATDGNGEIYIPLLHTGNYTVIELSLIHI